MKLINAYTDEKTLFFGKTENFAAEFLNKFVRPESVTLEIHESNGYACCPDLWSLLLVTDGKSFIDSLNNT